MDSVDDPSGPEASGGAPPAPTPGSWESPPGYATAPGPGYGPPPGYGYPGWPPPVPGDAPGGRLRRLGRNAGLGWGVAGVLALAVIALAVALGTQGSSPARATAPLGGGPAASVPGGGGPGRFGGGPLGGGSAVVGTVSSVSSKSFVVQDRSGSSVTVDEQPSTTYLSGRSSATASVVVSGARVVVQGTRTGDTVSATRVLVLPAGGFGGFGSATG